MLKRIFLALTLLALPGTAAAECTGANLLAKLQRDDPAAYAEIAARAAQTPNGEGRFWRVERAGAPPSWLLGTFHDTSAGAEALPPAIDSAIGGARLVLVELTEAENARMKQQIESDPGFITMPGGNGIIAQLSDEERAIAGPRLAARGLTLPMAETLKPWMLFSVLALPPCVMREAQMGKPILDDMLARRATEAGIPVAGLETYEDALGALTDLPVEDVATMVLDLLRSPNPEEDVWFTTASLYRRGEIAMIWQFSAAEARETIGEGRSAEVFGGFERKLLDERNAKWMDILAPAMAEGNVFAAFGALHLVGETGIVELLRGRGFTVTRQD